MRWLPPFLLVPALALASAASAPAQHQARPLEEALQQARSEQAAAENETRRLESLAAKARGRADKLRAEQAAAAQAIEAAEARITAAEAEYRLSSAQIAAQRLRLAAEQRPASSLLAGLATMARRPPLMALVDGGGTDEMVKIGILLDSSLPVIRNRTRALSADLARAQALEAKARASRSALNQSRAQLAARRNQFAKLERQAMQQSLARGGQALRTGDAAIAAAEQVERIRQAEADAGAARRLAALLAEQDPAPLRPFKTDSPLGAPPFDYRLPVTAPVIEGLGEVNASGVQSRGDRFGTSRGAPVTAPAAGVVRFSGPFRDYDGVVILDHGDGWISLIVNISSPLKVGARVAAGDAIGRALGPIEVQLSHGGVRLSPALIAGSSANLSKGGKRG